MIGFRPRNKDPMTGGVPDQVTSSLIERLTKADLRYRQHTVPHVHLTQSDGLRVRQRRSVVPTAATRPFSVRRAPCRSLSSPAPSKEVMITLSCVRSANPTNTQWHLSPGRGYRRIMQAPLPVETHGPLLGAAALWLVMLSPLSALLIGVLGAWLVS
jgi:hypothetical protein